MSSLCVNTLIQKYKHKIKNVGILSDDISQIKLILRDSYPDEERLFAVEGIWAHQKLLDAKIEIKAFLFCSEYVIAMKLSL